MKKILSIFLSSVILIASLVLFPETGIETSAAGKTVNIVIDPGHGGEGDTGHGAQYNGMSEKELTMKVATALKNELEKYDNVNVYLTRTTDTKLGLEDRAEIAKSVGADFVYSIHFNASAAHEFYGSEVWTSAFGEYYQAGCNFGQIMAGEWSSLGLYQKGTKSKIGKQGQDYYGIIRHCVARNIPCVILEHAYLDHGYDVPKVKSYDFLNKLAVADATAIAKYFKLTSSKTGADFSGYSYTSVKKPSRKVYQDDTDPEVCNIKVLATDPASGNILVDMAAIDGQSPIIYFSYSYDGGNTYSLLQMWDRTQTQQSFNVKVPSGTVDPVIVCKCFNNFEKFTISNAVPVQGSFNY